MKYDELMSDSIGAKRKWLAQATIDCHLASHFSLFCVMPDRQQKDSHP